jgi:zinc protease
MSRLAALALVLLVAAPSARAAEELVVPPVTRTTLANGLRVLVAEYHELPLVDVAVFVGAGAAQDPPGKDGVASLTAATLKRGAGKLSAEDVARAIESVGGTIGAAAGTDATIVTSEFLADDFATGLDLLRQVLREPAFARDEVRRARDEQAAALVAELEEPAAIADKCFAAWLYGRHPYGRPLDGRRKTVPELGRGDVRDFYDRWYRPNDTIMVLVGDVRADDAVARIQAAFGDWKPRQDAIAVRAGAPEPVAARRVLLVDKPDATQTQIRVGAIAMARRDPELLPAQVANTVLGGGFTSQLIEELRVKRSLTYGAASVFVARLTGGDFRMSTFTKTPTTAETLRLALDVEDRFRSQPIDPKQLTKAKTYMRGQFPLRLETPDALAAKLAEVEFFGLPQDELVTFRSRVDAVTPDVASRAAAKHMPPPDRTAIVVVGKAAEIRAGVESAVGPVTVVTPEACDSLDVAPR